MTHLQMNTKIYSKKFLTRYEDSLFKFHENLLFSRCGNADLPERISRYSGPFIIQPGGLTYDLTTLN